LHDRPFNLKNINIIQYRMDISHYYAYWNSIVGGQNVPKMITGGTCTATKPNLPKIQQVIYIKQRGEGSPMYEFDRLFGTSGRLCGHNFISYICKEEYDKVSQVAPDVEYDSNNGIWICGEVGDPDFLYYLLRQARGQRIDYFITKEEMVQLRPIYKKYNFDDMVAYIDYANSWCLLF
jgi:hypothetical protein